MSVCPNCGTENIEGSKFCKNCGAPLKASAGKASDAGKNFSQPVQSAPAADMGTPGTSMGGDQFIDPDEHEIARLGMGYLASMFEFGSIARNLLVLTDRRLYFSGKAYVDGRMKKVTTTVDVENITSTGCQFFARLAWIIWGIILIVLGMVFSDVLDQAVGLIVAVGVLFIILYFVLRTRYYAIAYKGGSLLIRANYYQSAAIDRFDRRLHQTTAKRKLQMLQNR